MSKPTCGTYRNYDNRSARQKWDWWLANRLNDSIPYAKRARVMEFIIREIYRAECGK